MSKRIAIAFVSCLLLFIFIVSISSAFLGFGVTTCKKYLSYGNFLDTTQCQCAGKIIHLDESQKNGPIKDVCVGFITEPYSVVNQ